MKSLPPLQIGKMGKAGIHQKSFPLSAACPILWLDATDSKSIIQAGGAVSQWKDKSGNNNHVYQSVSSDQPRLGTINGNNSIRSNGSSQYLNIPHINNLYLSHSVYMVAMYEITPSYPAQFISLNGTGATVDKRQPFIYVNSDDTLSINVGGAPINSAAPTISINSPFIVKSKYDGAHGTFTLNGEVIKNTYDVTLTEGGDTGRILGTTGYNIGEIIVFDRIISTLQHHQISTYLTEKWGI